MRHRRTVVLGVGIFVLVVLSLQIFLLMVGLEALLTFDTGIAWGAAITSVLLALVSLTLFRYLQRPPISDTTSRRPRTAPDREAKADQPSATDARRSSTTNRHTV